MKGSWDEWVAPALLEVAGRDTAENASRTLPVVLALGEARHVAVVPSAWHLRVPWFFAPYRRYGLRVSFRVSAGHGHWPRTSPRSSARAASRERSGRPRLPRSRRPRTSGEAPGAGRIARVHARPAGARRARSSERRAESTQIGSSRSTIAPTGVACAARTEE
jgi:hypothetical protein